MTEDVEHMTDEEIMTEIQALRDRRAQARQSRITATLDKESKPRAKKGPDEIGGDAADLLKNILGDL